MAEGVLQKYRSAPKPDLSVFNGPCPFIVAGICHIHRNRQSGGDPGCAPGSAVFCKLFTHRGRCIDAACTALFFCLSGCFQYNVPAQPVIQSAGTEPVIQKLSVICVKDHRIPRCCRLHGVLPGNRSDINDKIRDLRLFLVQGAVIADCAENNLSVMDDSDLLPRICAGIDTAGF